MLNFNKIIEIIISIQIIIISTFVPVFLEIPNTSRFFGTFEIPITYQVPAIIVITLIFKRNIVINSFSVYLIIGLFFIPVFHEGGSLGYLLTPNFGYLLGIYPLIVIIDKFKKIKTKNIYFDFIKYGMFIKSSKNFFKDRLGVSFGVRFDQDSFTSESSLLENTSPRLALSYILSKDNRWKLNFTMGRYFKIPTYTSLGFKNLSNQYVNKASKYTRSDHLVSGIEFNSSPSSRFTFEAFYKIYDNYPVSVLDGVSLANKGADFEVLGNEAILTSGKGKAYGLEFLYQQKLSNNFYGIFSYTFFYSKFSGLDNKFLPSVWDNRHLLSFTGGYKLKKNWELSAKFRYNYKTPYPPVNLSASAKAYPEIIYDYSQLGNYYLNDFGKLDIRIDKRWNYKTTSLKLYFEIENILLDEIPRPPEYGIQRDGNGEIINPLNLTEVISERSRSLIPGIGIVFDF